jgi:hypothetical protein
MEPKSLLNLSQDPFTVSYPEQHELSSHLYFDFSKIPDSGRRSQA